ncbi:P1 family peptidase [Arthrobacter globiformis]|uniref:Peptidase S58 family protein n=1 Tax=Arthrobacter globiformis TaxID=1665 RepID=A0A328HBV9_ARTGO|nr:P1 family peptidase [Arthrobacter globiformis]RAM36042.1 peptidase S58 family protein [Arthrobacter globiformis]
MGPSDGAGKAAGAQGKITDVAGVRVGHQQKSDGGWLSGVTVVLPPAGTVGSVDVRGGGPGTHETDALDPTTLVHTVDSVVLTGGSAYGLVTAHGVQRWCEEQSRGFAVMGGVVPIVPAAAIFDLGRGGDFGARPDAAMGYAAAAAAGAQTEGHDVGRGNVGAGTGAVIGRGKYKGGVGTASVTLEIGVVVGALAIVNALGLPFGFEPAQTGTEPNQVPASLNTTLVVVATNAVLDVAECKRTASAAHAGLARALNPSHTLADGDTVFCLATGAQELDRSTEAARQISLITLQSAAADVVRLAILDGISSARAVTTPAGEFGAYPGNVR